MPRQLFKISKQTESFIEYILLHMLFPLITIFVADFMFVNHFTALSLKSLTIATAMYLAKIFSASKYKIIKVFCFFGSVIFVFAYGFSFADSKITGDITWVKSFSVATIIVIFIMHFIEKYNRHISLKEEF